jgi:dTDP-4-dehydrorhamnose reductase
MTNPRILVTGGSGYLGEWVVRLARSHWDVTATYLNRPVDREEDEPGVTWHRLDVRDGAAVGDLVHQVRPAVIVHTAALNPGQGTGFEATNAAGSRHVARAAAACGARLIHVSTDVVFDGERGNYVEEDPPAPITPYGRSKALAEAEVRASGAEALIVRTSLIYGWRPRPDRNTRWVVGDLSAGRPVRLFTDELRCPIWVESLAAALVELAGLGHTGILHVAGAQALSRYELGVRLARFHGLDPGPLIPARSRESGLHRPLDCTLDCSRARALLRTPLPGVDEVLGRLSRSSHCPIPGDDTARQAGCGCGRQLPRS